MSEHVYKCVCVHASAPVYQCVCAHVYLLGGMKMLTRIFALTYTSMHMAMCMSARTLLVACATAHDDVAAHAGAVVRAGAAVRADVAAHTAYQHGHVSVFE